MNDKDTSTNFNFSTNELKDYKQINQTNDIGFKKYNKNTRTFKESHVVGDLIEETSKHCSEKLSDFVSMQSNPQFATSQDKMKFELKRDFFHLNVDLLKFIGQQCKSSKISDLTPSLEDYISHAKTICQKYTVCASSTSSLKVDNEINVPASQKFSVAENFPPSSLKVNNFADVSTSQKFSVAENFPPSSLKVNNEIDVPASQKVSVAENFPPSSLKGNNSSNAPAFQFSMASNFPPSYFKANNFPDASASQFSMDSNLPPSFQANNEIDLQTSQKISMASNFPPSFSADLSKIQSPFENQSSFQTLSDPKGRILSQNPLLASNAPLKSNQASVFQHNPLLTATNSKLALNPKLFSEISDSIKQHSADFDKFPQDSLPSLNDQNKELNLNHSESSFSSFGNPLQPSFIEAQNQNKSLNRETTGKTRLPLLTPATNSNRMLSTKMSNAFSSKKRPLSSLDNDNSTKKMKDSTITPKPLTSGSILSVESKNPIVGGKIAMFEPNLTNDSPFSNPNNNYSKEQLDNSSNTTLNTMFSPFGLKSHNLANSPFKSKATVSSSFAHTELPKSGTSSQIGATDPSKSLFSSKSDTISNLNVTELPKSSSIFANVTNMDSPFSHPKLLQPSSFGDGVAIKSSVFAPQETLNQPQVSKNDDGEDSQEEYSKQLEMNPVEPNSFYHQMCRLYYKKDNNWKIVGRGVVNLITSNKSTPQVIVLVRQSPSINSKILLNIGIDKKLDSFNIIEPTGICVVSIANPPLIGEKDGDSFTFLLKFSQKNARLEFEEKFNEKLNV